MSTNKNSRAAGAGRKNLAAFIVATIIFIGITVLSLPASAVTLEDPSSVITTDGPLPVISIPSPAPVTGDPCLSHLKQVSSSPSYAMDRNYGYDAKKAAAIGLVFGVKFALGPKEVTKRSRGGSRFTAWQPQNVSGNNEALAIADYRRCKNEQSLKAISDWRWQR